ncbi:ethanolamine utilization protein EutJ [Vagococcus sp. PNs007]|uniref:Ethanolamine utilization protein EutJ n=1 Tax=Vagococcus proximus TaxID=2991417 RepID=A0ABT5X2I5_9ENTE|nr:ethanolamine utilization protein EutJ [Vagococcus proximus]MDF0480178.1 ethanolamine utilization protein EutJ [Vagococcus proximus]
MKKSNYDLSQYDQFIQTFEKVIKTPKQTNTTTYYTGVDLGTACVVLAVLDDSGEPVAGAYEYADVVRDGMVVDYIGAIEIVTRLKKSIEANLGCELLYAASAIPPGTDLLDSGAIKNVIEASGFELVSLLDEPTAANQLLSIQNGAVVDIGGGTTGISVVVEGEVVKVADEATGGTHFSLVVSGSYGMTFDEAELYKRSEKNHKELLTVLKPVIEKIASIIDRQIMGHQVEEVYLVGGTACLTGMETIIEKSLGIPTFKPINPMFVTPLGIAKNCYNKQLN